MEIWNEKSSPKKVSILAFSTGVALLSGCAAMSTAIQHRKLAVSSRMSDTIFWIRSLRQIKPYMFRLKVHYLKVFLV